MPPPSCTLILAYEEKWGKSGWEGRRGNSSQDVRERNLLSIKENFILSKKNDKVTINTGQGRLL